MAISVPYTGEHGAVTVNGVTVLHTRRWTASMISQNKQFASSSTNGRLGTAKGNRTENGSFEIYFAGGGFVGVPGMNITRGDLITFRGYFNTAAYYEQIVRVDTIDFGVDIEGNELQGCTINWTGHEDPTIAGGPTPTPAPTPTL